MSYISQPFIADSIMIACLMQRTIVKWVARCAAAGIVLFGLPFYLGYGNPLPFIDESYSLLENLWLIIFPLLFVGLILGWINEKLGGFIVVIPSTIGLLANLAMEGDIAIHMLAPLCAGCLYLIAGYHTRKDREQG